MGRRAGLARASTANGQGISIAAPHQGCQASVWDPAPRGRRGRGGTYTFSGTGTLAGTDAGAGTGAISASPAARGSASRR
jgi:hypothetical protein